VSVASGACAQFAPVTDLADLADLIVVTDLNQQ
jgi:hypothetical protein